MNQLDISTLAQEVKQEISQGLVGIILSTCKQCHEEFQPFTQSTFDLT